MIITIINYDECLEPVYLGLPLYCVTIECLRGHFLSYVRSSDLMVIKRGYKMFVISSSVPSISINSFINFDKISSLVGEPNEDTVTNY